MSEATQTVAASQLRAVIERIERLEEERQTIAADIRDVKAEAKGTGFSVPTINAILKLRKKDQAEREEAEALLDTYLAALGMLPQGDLFNDTPIPSQDGKTESEGLASAPVTEQPEMAKQSDFSAPLVSGPSEASNAYAGTASDTNPAPHSEQARVSSTALAADPAKPLPLGSWVGHPFNDTGPHVFSDSEVPA